MLRIHTDVVDNESHYPHQDESRGKVSLAEIHGLLVLVEENGKEAHDEEIDEYRAHSAPEYMPEVIVESNQVGVGGRAENGVHMQLGDAEGVDGQGVDVRQCVGID
jgi:hypothetical protein